MNKLRIFTILPILLCLLSCGSSSHDAPIVEPDPKLDLVGISFGSANDSWQDAPTSRASNTGLETLFHSFRVWGYKTTNDELSDAQTVMDGYHVEYATGTLGSSTSNTEGWEYVGMTNPYLSATQTIKYWDYAATSYRFFGYSPFNAEAKISASTTALATCSVAFPYAYTDDATATSYPYVSDLWVSTNSTSSSLRYGQCVKLTFAPLIAKVRFMFSYPDGTTEMTIKNISFCDNRFSEDSSIADTPIRGSINASFSTIGSATEGSPQLSWTPATDNATGRLVMTLPYEKESDNIHIVSDPTQYEKWYYMPPLSIIPYKQGPYTINASINGNHSSATVPAEFMQWKAGYQYTYIFKITEANSAITFSELKVEKWLPGSNFDNNGTGTEGW